MVTSYYTKFSVWPSAEIGGRGRIVVVLYPARGMKICSRFLKYLTVLDPMGFVNPTLRTAAEGRVNKFTFFNDPL